MRTSAGFTPVFSPLTLSEQLFSDAPAQFIYRCAIPFTMDDLVAMGTLALAFMYGGAIILAVGVVAILYFCWQAVAAGNIFFVTGIAIAFAVAAICYAAIGLFLRKTGTI
jgi:hypothetical protein